MAVLQTKHVFVRLFGLAHKTVIIDEVHAYDAYMSTLLERLLEWLAALGSPVILLSATLPVSRRNALIKAYQKGLDVETGEIEMADYPRISYATDSMIKVRHIESSTKNQTLHIKKLVDENFIEELKVKLENKRGCTAIICNTVKRSQDIYEQLSKDQFFDGKVDLLHSRFRFCDRDAIEKRVRLGFGKEGEKVRVTENGNEIEREVERPDFAVLVSTQIIEQSLDIDFDLMISDLAPIDLLLQRAGRLHRHDRERKEEFKEATLWIIQPEIKDHCLPNFENSSVYDEHILLRTWLELNKKEYEKIEIPAEIEKLIEAVYDKKRDCFDENYQIFWNETKIRMDEKLKLKRAKAKTCRITDCDDEDLFENDILNLDEDNPEVHKTLQALTRDDEMPSVSVVVLTYKEAKKIDLNAKPNKKTIEFLLKRETKISKKGLTNLIIADENLKQKSWKDLALLRHHRLLELDENNERILGNFKVSLNENLGIVIEKTGGKNE
jgi:CRISPR-associated endonuclease/helicase Cas3